MCRRKPYTEAQKLKVYNLAAKGVNDNEIAAHIDLHPYTIGKITSMFWSEKMELKHLNDFREQLLTKI